MKLMIAFGVALAFGMTTAAYAGGDISKSRGKSDSEVKQQVDPNFPPSVPSPSERKSNPGDPRNTDNQMGFGRNALPPDDARSPGYTGADQEPGHGKNMGGRESSPNDNFSSPR
jgi:hypothetical protein